MYSIYTFCLYIYIYIYQFKFYNGTHFALDTKFTLVCPAMGMSPSHRDRMGQWHVVRAGGVAPWRSLN